MVWYGGTYHTIPYIHTTGVVVDYYHTIWYGGTMREPMVVGGTIIPYTYHIGTIRTSSVESS